MWLHYLSLLILCCRFSLCQAYIEHGKFLPLDEELTKEEKAIEKQKSEKAAARLKKETVAATSAERKKKTRERYATLATLLVRLESQVFFIDVGAKEARKLRRELKLFPRLVTSS